MGWSVIFSWLPYVCQLLSYGLTQLQCDDSEGRYDVFYLTSFLLV